MVYVLYTLLANLVPALVKAYCSQQGQEFQNHKGTGSSQWWFWNWSGQGQGKGSSRAAAGQQHGQQQRQEFQNHQNIACQRRGKLKMVVLELVRAGAAAGQQHGQQQGQEFQNHQKIAFWRKKLKMVCN